MQSGEVSARTPADKRALLQQLLEEQRASPLSAGQRWLWLLQQLAPGSPAYNFSIALRINSVFDPALLRRCLQDLVNRHAAFRTRFTLQNGEPVQTVQEGAQVSFDIVDASGWSTHDLLVRVTRESERPLDLTAGPVFRATLFDQGQAGAVLLLVWHHLVLDGWSLAIVMDELSASYAAYAEGHEPELPTPVPYTEFVRWQQRMLASDEGTRQAEFWRHQLEHAEGLDLVTDAQRPAQRSYRGGSLFFTIGESLTQDLRKLAASEGTTVFVVLLAGFEALLHRVTGQENISVSFPVSGRSESRFARTAGYFVNQVVVAGDIDAQTTFRSLVAQIHGKVLGALEHQEYHLSLLPRTAGPGDPERPRFSDVLFVLQKSQGYRLEAPRGSYRESGMLSADTLLPSGDFGGLPVEAFPIGTRTARFDLELQMMEHGGSLNGWLQYDLDLFEEPTARGLTERFQRLLAVMAADIDQRVSSADILSGEEQQRLLLDWNRTQREWPPGTITELFERQVRATPDVVAALCGYRHLTFDELDRKANRVAHWLRRSGARPQDIVGLSVPRSLEMLVALLGIIKAGCIYLPLEATNPIERLKYLVKDSGATFVITSSETCGRFRRSEAQELCLHCDSAAIDEALDTAPGPSAAPILYVAYTSGSTGEPKGVLGTQRGALNRFHWMWERYPFADREVCAQVTTLRFVDAVWEIFGPLLRGIPLALIPDEDVRDTERLVGALGSQSVTRITLVPSLLRVLLESAEVGSRLPFLRYWSCSGEALEPDLARLFYERIPHAKLLNLYGCSEASADSCYFEVPPDWNGHRLPIGRPIANTRVFLLDRHGRLTSPGSVGEIHVGGSGLAAGYLGRPELTAERFVTSPLIGERLYRTGDLGRYLPDGAIEYFGRADLQVKIRGHRVELGEVEVALRSHPEVESAVVEGVKEPSGDRALVAYIVTRSESLTDGALRAHLAARLPGYMFPSEFVRLDQMPLTATGKINRRALVRPPEAPRLRGYVAPRNETERRLVEVWSQVLNARQLGVEDDFFEWGGHSILALQAVARASQVFKRQLPVALLIKLSTVASLAAYLDGNTRSERRHQLVAIEPRGTRPPLFWIPGGAGTPVRVELKALAGLLGPTQPLYGLGSQRAEIWSEIESVPERASGYVKAIRELQPEGPYYLTGFCLGGVIAFEAARQLNEQGQKVAFLALLNTWMPAGSISRSQWLLLFLQRAMYHARAAVRRDGFRAHHYILSRLRAARRAVHRYRSSEHRESQAQNTAAAGDPMGEDAVLRATVRLASKYVPQHFEGKVHVFFSEEPDLEGVSARLDPRRAWRRICSDCEMIHVPGGHLELLNPPFVEPFATQFRRRLREAQP